MGALWLCDNWVSVGGGGGGGGGGRGGMGGGGTSAIGNGRETSKLDLLTGGTVLRLSEWPKSESCGDDGWLKLLRLGFRETLLSLEGEACFDSSTAPELFRLLTSFRVLGRLVVKTSPMIPQYATSAFSSWAEDSRKAALMPYAVGSWEQCCRSVLEARIRAGRYDVRRDGGCVRVFASNRKVRQIE